MPTSVLEAVGRVALALWERGLWGDVELRRFGEPDVVAQFTMLQGPKALELEQRLEREMWASTSGEDYEDDHGVLDDVDNYVEPSEDYEDVSVYYPPASAAEGFDEDGMFFDQDGNTIDEEGNPYDE